MKRPLRYRTMGAVREGRGNPSPYSIAGRKASEKKRLTAQLRMQSVRFCVEKDTMIVFTINRNEPHAIYVSHSLLSGRHR